MENLKQWAIITLVCTVVFSMFGGTAFSASTRYALVTDVTGTVKVKKAGGSKEIRVFKGIGLNEGDKLKVEKGSSVTLSVADRDDEVVLGEHWKGTLSKLKSNASGGTDTAVKTWAGSMYNKVERITGTSNTYKVETPTAVMGVRGTHFTISIDPVSGLPTMFVSAGKVTASDSAEESPPALVLPAQQITVFHGLDLKSGVQYVDPDSILEQAGTDVIAALLKNKQLIDEENNEILGTIPQEEDTQEQSTLDLNDGEVFDQYRRNVDNVLFNFLKSVSDSGKIGEEDLQEIINQANQEITDQIREYDLNKAIPPINKNAGIDPIREAERQRELLEAERKKLQQLKQKEERKKEIADRNAELLKLLEEEKKKQDEENKKAAEKAALAAAELLKNMLDELEQKELQERLEQRQQEKEQQEESRSTPPPTQTEPDTNSGGGTGTTLAATTTTLSSDNPTKAVLGQPVTLRATVIPANAVTPSGTITFKRGTETIDTVSLSGTTAELTGITLPEGVHTITATYSGSSTLQSSMASQTLAVVKPSVTVEKSGAGTVFNVTMKLSNFISPKQIYGVQFHFLHDPSYEFIHQSSYYNGTKFPNADVVAEMIKTESGTSGGVAMEETIYALTLFGTGTEAVEFDAEAELAAIPFTGISGSLKLAHVQFVDHDGNPIDVTVNYDTEFGL